MVQGNRKENPDNRFNKQVILGSYVFERDFYSRCIDKVLELGNDGRGAGMDELSGHLNISRSALKEIVNLCRREGRGLLVRGRFFSGKEREEKILSSFERNILERLKDAGREGLDPLVMKIPGSPEALERLTDLKLAVRIGDNLFWDACIPGELTVQILRGCEIGTRINVASVRGCHRTLQALHYSAFQHNGRSGSCCP